MAHHLVLSRLNGLRDLRSYEEVRKCECEIYAFRDELWNGTVTSDMVTEE